MDAGTISMRYARALLAYAGRHGVTDRVYADTEVLADSYARYPSLRRVLSNRIADPARKVELLAACSGGEKCSAEFRRFLEHVVAAGREEFLSTICMDYRELVRRANNLLDVWITTAVKPDLPTLEHFERRLQAMTGKHVRLNTAVDPALVGGYVLRWDTYRLDRSVKGMLDDIGRKIKSNFG